MFDRVKAFSGRVTIEKIFPLPGRQRKYSEIIRTIVKASKF